MFERVSGRTKPVFLYNSNCGPLNIEHKHYQSPTRDQWRSIHHEFQKQVQVDPTTNRIVAYVDPSIVMTSGYENQEYCLYSIRQTHDKRNGRDYMMLRTSMTEQATSTRAASTGDLFE
jgi:hypothetical protein